jgi:hypothetical protein
MSITFYAKVPGVAVDYDEDDASLNMSNSNALDLLGWLGFIEADYCGDVMASDLAALCRRRLWPEARNVDPALPAVVDKKPGRATFVVCGRDAGYLQARTTQLLTLCEKALAQNPSALIVWG